MLQDMPMVPEADPDLPGDLELGAFSVSLNVADLDVSRVFYEALGFAVSGGDAEHGYLIMKNGESTIGLFHGVFEGNILTFNPGLTNRMERIERYLDVREIGQRLVDAGLSLQTGIDPEAGPSGPAHVTLSDPDGNAILIDQFF
jgi:catechol 2,3-dioxygenase-like lactoylglutathione lyase family enzyme